MSILSTALLDLTSTGTSLAGGDLPSLWVPKSGLELGALQKRLFWDYVELWLEVPTVEWLLPLNLRV